MYLVLNNFFITHIYISLAYNNSFIIHIQTYVAYTYILYTLYAICLACFWAYSHNLSYFFTAQLQGTPPPPPNSHSLLYIHEAVLCSSHLFLYVQLLSSVKITNNLNDCVEVLQKDFHVTHQGLQVMPTTRVTLACRQVTQELAAVWQRLHCHLQTKQYLSQCTSCW